MYSDYGFTTEPSLSNVESTVGAITGAAIALVIIVALIAIAIGVLMIIANCKMFSKAGEKWWKALIPGYSTWVETKIAGLAWWWFPIFIGLSAVTTNPKSAYVAGTMLFLVSFNYNRNMSLRFGKGNGFAVLLTLLPVIGLPMLAFGSAKYNKDADTDKNGIFAVENKMVK